MGRDIAIEFADSLLYEKTGRHLSDLQCCILQQVWVGHTYGAIATAAGYSEGHIKDVASQLWRLLSDVLGERITKGNCRSRLKYWLVRAKHQVVRGLILAPPTPPIRSVLEPSLDPGFVGRETALADLDTVVGQGHQVIVIQGEGGLGKTTLAQHYLRHAGFDRTLELLMAQETANITPVERVVEEWLLQDFHQEPGHDFGITLDRLKRQLRQQRVGILIDNLEPALDAQGQFVSFHRRYVDLIRALSDVSIPSITLITSRDRLCEPGLKLYTYHLPRLTVLAWTQFFARHQLATPTSPLQAMHWVYGGNAKAMAILCGTIQTEYDGKLETYWQLNHTDPLVETDLRNLVVSQVNRLQRLDMAAYQLLCRLGCYRYQTIATLPLMAVIAQLDDVPASQHRQVITSLRNRSLLEVRQGQYWLHPVVRAVAIERLRTSGLWEKANQCAATYWTQSIHQVTTLTEGLQALEGYYHALEIQDYEAAADVLLKSRHNQWGQFLPLASSLYRMGLLQPVIEAILQVLPQLENQLNHPKLSELSNILGDVYWITGQIRQAIHCQQRAIATTDCLLNDSSAQKSLDKPLSIPLPSSLPYYYLKMLNVDSRLSIGLYKIDLWELVEARSQFETVIALSQGTQHDAWAIKATVALALVDSYLGNKDNAQGLANKFLKAFKQSQQQEFSGRFAYFMQLLGQTYSNLGDPSQALNLYQQAITFADAGHYLQVKARALTGLAILYSRWQQWSEAINHHTQAIELLETIGARCDLAEAHLQYGLTLQSYSLSAKTATLALDRAFTITPSPDRHFDQAIKLFSAINAPRQVEKVRQLAESISAFSEG